MNETNKAITETEIDRIIKDDIRYFEDKVKRNPDDKKAQKQLKLLKEMYDV